MTTRYLRPRCDMTYEITSDGFHLFEVCDLRVATIDKGFEKLCHVYQQADPREGVKLCVVLKVGSLAHITYAIQNLTSLVNELGDSFPTSFYAIVYAPTSNVTALKPFLHLLCNRSPITVAYFSSEEKHAALAWLAKQNTSD